MKTEFGIRLDNLEASSEMEIYRNLQALRASHRVFNGNYHELVRCLEHLKNPRKSLFLYTPERRENLELLIDEASRLFHNFLASAKSLVDHTRVIINRLYSNHEFRNEYQKKLEQEIANNPVQKFIQNLRNYTQHYTLPILALEIAFKEDIEMSMRVDVKILKQWDKWGSSINYLETLGDSLCLLSLSTQYFTIIQSFYCWLADKQTQIHKSDFDNLQRMKDELTI